MGEDGEPKWYYVGNGQIRYKDTNGWTDQYQDIEGHPKTSEAEASVSTGTSDPARSETGREGRAREPSSFSRLCSSAAHRSMAGLAHAGGSLLHAGGGLRTVLTQARTSVTGTSLTWASAPREAIVPEPLGQLSPEWRVVLGVGEDAQSPPSVRTFTAHGTLTLTRRNNGIGSWRQSGTDGNEALSSGAPVTIADMDGQTLALGQLEAAEYAPGERDRSIGTSVFTFTVDDIPSGEDSYAVVVDGHCAHFTDVQMMAGPSLRIAEPDPRASSAS